LFFFFSHINCFMNICYVFITKSCFYSSINPFFITFNIDTNTTGHFHC